MPAIAPVKGPALDRKDNAELIAELESRRIEIVSRIKRLNGYINSLDAVIVMFTLLSPQKIALEAINENPDKIWNSREISHYLIHAIRDNKLDREISNVMVASNGLLLNLSRKGILERVSRGQYKKIIPDQHDGDNPLAT